MSPAFVAVELDDVEQHGLSDVIVQILYIAVVHMGCRQKSNHTYIRQESAFYAFHHRALHRSFFIESNFQFIQGLFEIHLFLGQEDGAIIIPFKNQDFNFVPNLNQFTG